LGRLGDKTVTKVIIIPEENLDRYYERTVERLRAKYHSRPSSLKNSHTIDASSNIPTPYQNMNYSQGHIPMGKLIG
jgi:hypothetical protein